MNELRAHHFHDQIMAAYTDPRGEANEVFGMLSDQAADQMTEEQWQTLQKDLDESYQRRLQGEH